MTVDSKEKTLMTFVWISSKNSASGKEEGDTLRQRLFNYIDTKISFAIRLYRVVCFVLQNGKTNCLFSIPYPSADTHCPIVIIW